MREPHYYWPVIVTLAVWRITHLLAQEDGPWKLAARLRRAASHTFRGSLLDCFYCLSLWISAPFAILLSTEWKERLILWPALSAAAILLERTTRRETAQIVYTPIEYKEDEENENVLWKRTNEVHR